MGDAAAVLSGITRRPGARYTALVPNSRGLERALAARADEIAIFAAASETFSRRNINQSIAASFETYGLVARDAMSAGVRVRAYLSTAFGCPFEGNVPPARVVELTQRLLDLGAAEVAVSDTIGIAHPGQVRALVQTLAAAVPLRQIALHFHDTRGMAVANVLAGFDLGVRTFDASAGGLGGCPYAPGARGNVATEDVIYLLNGLPAQTGVDLDALCEASRPLEDRVGHALPSRYLQAYLARTHAGS
jgi:hydroxymethylglutaryl-CoA lyase